MRPTEHGTNHSVSLRGRADDRCWPTSDVAPARGTRPLSSEERTSSSLPFSGLPQDPGSTLHVDSLSSRASIVLLKSSLSSSA